MPHYSIQPALLVTRWTKSTLSLTSLSLIMLTAALTGCGGKDTILPQDGETMSEIFKRHAGGSAEGALLDARSQLRRPLGEDEVAQAQYFLSDNSSDPVEYRRLENPDLVMYVFPHRTPVDDAPVPGYTTVFPMYEQIYYALPGEPRE